MMVGSWRSNQILRIQQAKRCVPRVELHPNSSRQPIACSIRCAVPDRKVTPIQVGSELPGIKHFNETATAMRRIAAESGPEAVAFAVTTPSGTAISDAAPWIRSADQCFWIAEQL
jgi:hypothetical protein